MKKVFTAVSFALIAAVAGQAKATVISISAGSVLGDAISTNFAGCATGALANACTGLPLSSVSVIGNAIVFNDTLGTGADGNALAVRNGQIVVVGINGAMDDQTSNGGFHFEFSRTFTQFGFRLVDQHSLRMRVVGSDGSIFNFDNGTTPFPMWRFSSSVALSSFDIVCVVGCGGFAVDDLMVAGLATEVPDTEVPEPDSLALAGLGLLAIAGAARRRRQSHKALR